MAAEQNFEILASLQRPPSQPARENGSDILLETESAIVSSQ